MPARVVAAVVCLSALALYVATMAPTVTLVDSGELIVVAWGLGVAHPPGFPLYTLVAHAFTWLPFGSIAERVHLLSAVCGALAAGVVSLLVVEVVRAMRAGDATGPPARPARRRRAPVAGEPAWVVPAAALTAGLLVTGSRTLWAYATVAEVYTLTVLLVAVALLLLLRWRRVALDGSTDRPALALYGAALALGLGLAVHHVTIVLVAPGCAWLVWSVAREREVPPSVWLRAAGCGAVGLLCYLYLPWAASGDPVLDWGDPSSLERFWWHVSGRQYQVYFSFSLETMARQLGDDFGRYALREFGPRWFPWALGLAALGAARLWRANRTVATALALIAVVDLAYALNYDIDEDKDAYYLPVFLVVATLAGVGATRALAIAAAQPLHARAGLAALVALAPVAAITASHPYDDRSEYFIARDYVANLVTTVAPGGMLLTKDWQVYAPSLYARHVDRARIDVVTIDVNLLRRSWYFDYLDREYPATMARVRAEADAYLAELREWDRDPDLYQRDLARNRRISETHDAFIDALIATHRPIAPVYMTLELLAQDPDFSRRLAGFALVPQGLVFQLTDPGTTVPVADPAFEMRGLFDGTIAFEPDDVVRQKVAPAYLSMLVNRGRYLASHGQTERAASLYREVLALDPSNGPAQASLDAIGR